MMRSCLDAKANVVTRAPSLTPTSCKNPRMRQDKITSIDKSLFKF